jgi:hypothetical protein
VTDPAYIVIELHPSEDDAEARFAVGALIEPAAALGLRVSHYRLLERPPRTWDEAEHLVRELNRGAPTGPPRP